MLFPVLFAGRGGDLQPGGRLAGPVSEINGFWEIHE
jgi:hypothetical protein